MTDITKIKPSVLEYAKNFTALMVTPLPDDIASYVSFFDFLFKKSYRCNNIHNVFDFWQNNRSDIDVIIIHIESNNNI